MLPLQGLTVVSLEHAIAAPFATRQLADLGARVIKVERSEGDFARQYDTRVRGLSSHFVWCNRSKQSVVLNLKSQEGLEALMRLVDRADVFVQNLAPGAVARMGFDAETLRKSHPRLILCDISGYGNDGPDHGRKAYDLLIQSESGFLSVTGSAEELCKAGCSISDIAAGMYAYSGILAALIERGRTGQGRHIDVSMLEASAEWMGYPLYYSFEGAPPPPRVGASHATIFPYGPFRTATGSIMFGVQNEREWEAFCRIVLERSDLAADLRFCTNACRNDNREILGQIINSVLLKLPRDTVLERLERARIANANINDMAELWAHPQFIARDRWRTVESPVGPIPALLPPGQAEARMDAIPAVGEHTDEILREIGMIA